MVSSVADMILDKRNPTAGPIPQEVLNSFQGKIAPIRTTTTYRLGIIAVWIVMVLLPMIYLALIALVAYGAYWHTVNNVGMLEHGNGRGKIVVLMAYLAPIITGSIMVLFMLKPLFARPPKRPKNRSLTREDEPLLFGFIDRVCTTVGAPIPKRVDIDCLVNASASFRHGFWSMLRGNDLVLTIGMPLVMGFSLRQFAGVLAHEFGHFSQATGMRLTYIIRSINLWFTRVVYERDNWDIWLDNTARSLDIRLSWVLHVARLFVWLSRRCLWMLMIIGQAVSGYLMRQMEYDADRHECRLAGSDEFAPTMRRLIELNIANSQAQQDMQEFYREGRLADDLPGLIQFNVQQFPEAYQAMITDLIEKSKTGYFDTHPADADRIKSAQAEHDIGVFPAAGPASILFSDVSTTCREVTTDFYEQIFGNEFRREAVHPLADLLVRQKTEMESLKSAQRYFQGTFSFLRPLPIPTDSTSIEDVVDAMTEKLPTEELAAEREFIVATAPSIRSSHKQFYEFDSQLLDSHCALAILSANQKIHSKQFSFSTAGFSSVDTFKKQTAAKSATIGSDLEQFESRSQARFATALKLLFHPDVSQKIERFAEQQSDCRRFLTVLQSLNRLIPPTIKLRNSRAALGTLFGYVKPDNNSTELIEQVKKQAAEIQALLVEIRNELEPLTYPFDHAQGTMSVADYVIKQIPTTDDYGGLYNTAEVTMDNIASLVSRLFGRLALIAERVEAAIGLPPLAEPNNDTVTQTDTTAKSVSD